MFLAFLPKLGISPNIKKTTLKISQFTD